MKRLIVELPDEEYENIITLAAVNIGRGGRFPYKGIVMYALNAIRRAEIIDDKAADKEPRWISVSERLPNHDEYIKNNGLFNVSDGNRSYSEWFDIYDKQRFGEPTMSGFRVDNAVTAWMPLPKPYEADKEQK